MVASAFGAYRDRAWRDRLGDEVLHDHLSDLSETHGWSASRHPQAPGGSRQPLWEIFDAGPLHPAPEGDESALVAWCHVGLLTPPEERLPAEELLACLDQAITRLGALDLRAVQVLLPLDSLSVQDSRRRHRERGASASGATGDVVAVSMDAGQRHDTRKALAALADAEASTGRAPSRRGGVAARLPPYVVGDAFWGGPPADPATFMTRVSSWDLTGVGRAVAELADAAVVAGAQSPVMLTVVAESEV